MPRNTVISICKAIAIILMVIGHAETPGLITATLYTFHMPLFFITAGYFFSRSNMDNPWGFCARRFKGLYVPFLKWSLLFLVLHNVWFHLGILNEQYGNWSGGVTHPYTWHAMASRLMLMVTAMAGYDEFMAGAFWFFRGLLVSSIVYMVLSKLLCDSGRMSMHTSAWAIVAIALAFAAFRITNGLTVKYIANGGMRETWGVMFFGIGVLFRRYEPQIRQHWALGVMYLLLLCAAGHFHLHGMNNTGHVQDLWSLPLTGTIGFLLVHYVSTLIDRRDGRLRRALVYIGDNTLYIFILHIICYKPVSLLKIWWYGLDPAQIGCHMVIHDYHEDWFWILYTIAGVGLPLAALKAWQYLKTSVPRLLPSGTSA